MSRSRDQGFTVLELMVVVAIIGILAALAYEAMSRSRPRATFESVSAELQSLIHSARQQALASGVPVAVLVFPDYQNAGAQGRIIVVQDDTSSDLSLFNAVAPLNFDNYDPGVPASTQNGQLVTTLDLPQGVLVGPATGLGVMNLAFPFDKITTNIACSFCNPSGNHRGAIVFDSRGRAKFYQAAGTISGDVNGASFSIYGTSLASGASFTTSTFVVTTASGFVSTFHNG